MGLDDVAIAGPIIGVVSMMGEQAPCNMTHGFRVEAPVGLIPMKCRSPLGGGQNLPGATREF